MAGDEPDIGTGAMTGGGGFTRSSRRRTVAGTLAAKVTTEGVRKLTSEFNGLWGVLKNVRAELGQINNLARSGGGGGGMGGVGQGTPTGAAGSNMTPMNTGGGLGGLPGSIARMVGGGGGGGGWGGQNTNMPGPGGYQFFSRMATGVAIADTGIDIIGDRFKRNVAQSAPISSQDVLTAAMYGPSGYQGMEMARYKAAGQYAGSREAVQSAQQVALGLGQVGGAPGTAQFLGQAGNVVQAYGGTINVAQAAGTAGLFAAPAVSNRARALGIEMYKTAGNLNNPMEVARGYVKDYEKRANVTLNEIDFANLRAPGSPLRMRMKQAYNLSDEAIDMVVTAGMENMQFRAKSGRDINFRSSQDINQIVQPSSLGMTAARFGTAAQRREARFFNQQEGAEAGRLQQEITIQEKLADVEDAFSGLLGPMHEFERVLKGITTALGLVAGAGMLRSLTGGGGGPGGLLNNILGRGGPGGTTAAAEGAEGAVGGAEGIAGGAGFMATAAPLAAVATGALVAGKGLQMAGRATNKGDIFESGLTTAAGGAAIGAGIGLAGGPFAPITVPVGAAVGTVVGFVTGTAFGAKNYFKSADKANKAKGFDVAVGMSDEDLVKNLSTYAKNAAPGGKARGEGAGPQERGRFDAFARRRGALLAAALDEAQTTDVIKLTSTTDAAELKSLVDFFGSDGVFDDSKLWSNKTKARKWIDQISSSGVWRKYFGGVVDPFAYTPVTTNESKSLVMTPDQFYSSSGAQSGDGAFSPYGNDPYPRGGDAIDDRALSKGDTWNKLDSRMKDRLLKLFRASGGRVWLGNGWRSSTQQEQMFRDRYVPDPNGSISWNGQKWRHVKGAAAAPPGRSYHEIGLAADLEGDMGWMNAHAGEFGLRHFADVNSEPWHVQPAEIPTGRSEFTGTSDGGTDGTGTTPTTAAPAAAATAQSFGSPSVSGASGIGYSIAAAAQAISAPGGGGSAPAGASTTAAGAAGGSGSGWTGDWPADVTAKGAAVAQVAYAAGFRGQDLVNMVAISFRESGWNPNSWVTDSDDVGGGLWAINQLPWLSKGLTPPWSKAEIQDPNRAAQIAKEMFDQRGYQPWTTAGGAMARTDQARAQAAVAAAHLTGDAVFDPGLSLTASAGRANVNINVSINSTGNVRYDAQALGDAVRPVLTNVMAEISTKRGS